MIVQETTVGEDDRAVGLGGKDALSGVVDGMCQRIDVISTKLYVRDVLDISFDVETTVGKLFTQISLDAYIEDFPVQADAVPSATLVKWS